MTKRRVFLALAVLASLPLLLVVGPVGQRWATPEGSTPRSVPSEAESPADRIVRRARAEGRRLTRSERAAFPRPRDVPDWFYEAWLEPDVYANKVRGEWAGVEIGRIGSDQKRSERYIAQVRLLRLLDSDATDQVLAEWYLQADSVERVWPYPPALSYGPRASTFALNHLRSRDPAVRMRVMQRLEQPDLRTTDDLAAYQGYLLALYPRDEQTIEELKAMRLRVSERGRLELDELIKGMSR